MERPASPAFIVARKTQRIGLSRRGRLSGERKQQVANWIRSRPLSHIFGAVPLRQRIRRERTSINDNRLWPSVTQKSDELWSSKKRSQKYQKILHDIRQFDDDSTAANVKIEAMLCRQFAAAAEPPTAKRVVSRCANRESEHLFRCSIWTTT